MEDKSETAILLERIAAALERIAASLDGITSPVPEHETDDLDPSASQESIEPAPVNKDITRLQNFLESRGITIKTIPNGHESDEILDKLALFIGCKLESITGVLDAIKVNMSSGRPFKLSLKNEPLTTVGDTTNLCTNLYNIAFLTAYHYQNSPTYLVNATPSTSPRALNFFSGQWLERFVKTQVISLCESNSFKYSYVCNPQISLPNGDDFELDMLVEVEGEIFWLEAKTGDYRRHIEKYSKMSKIMGLDCSHTIMILADSAVNDKLAKDLSNLFGMTVIRIEKFAEQLARVLPENKNNVIHELESS